jgi:hypothetical protein
MPSHLDTKNLVPFSKRRNGFRLPGMQRERDEEMLEQVDPNLQPEDEGVIRRYLRYADTLLGGPDAHELTLVSGGSASDLTGKTEWPMRFTATEPGPKPGKDDDKVC